MTDIEVNHIRSRDAQSDYDYSTPDAADDAIESQTDRIVAALDRIDGVELLGGDVISVTGPRQWIENALTRDYKEGEERQISVKIGNTRYFWDVTPENMEQLIDTLNTAADAAQAARDRVTFSGTATQQDIADARDNITLAAQQAIIDGNGGGRG